LDTGDRNGRLGVGILEFARCWCHVIIDHDHLHVVHDEHHAR